MRKSDGHHPPKYVVTDLGVEKICSICQEYWPLDDEFFYRRGAGFNSACKACYNERYLDALEKPLRTKKYKTRV